MQSIHIFYKNSFPKGEQFILTGVLYSETIFELVLEISVGSYWRERLFCNSQVKGSDTHEVHQLA